MTNYHRRLYERYVATHFGSIRDVSVDACERQRKFFRAYFRRFLPGDKHAKIIDIGCGYGAFLYFLRKEGYQDVAGVDISPEQVEAARQLGIANVHCEDLVTFLQKHQSSFDCITALDVIEHFPKEEILPLCGAAYEALGRGGAFIIQAPNGGSPFCGTLRYADFTHELAFTKESVTQVLRAVGFNDVRVFPTGPVVHGIPSGARFLLWHAIEFLLRIYLLAETGSFRGHILTQNLIALGRK